MSDYNIIVLSHAPSDNTLPSYDNILEPIQNIMEAINNKTTYTNETFNINVNYTNTTNKIICYISGHNHMDRSNVKNNVLNISTACDACYQDNKDNEGNLLTTRIRNTISEQAFDVFTIDLDNNIIKTVRFGGGDNREWNI